MNYEFEYPKIEINRNQYTVTKERDTIWGDIGIYKFRIIDISEKYFGLRSIGGIKIYEAEVKISGTTVVTFTGTSFEQMLQDVINYLTYALSP